ncbi:HEAT repeat domain-containing protein [Longispora sp. K20-0274]|uniref:HEAT repeat domain-containing protein n=1 Tax=Longispora sp. K20-0274 TaxID=3088255 RepID=UPI00399A3B66
MLDGLDDVQWARLGHAYGPADDVPDLIRALCSPEEKERAAALHQLYGNIFHQGTRYEATAYAVPFLLEVLAAPATRDRAALLGLLAAITVGYDENWLPDAIPIAEFRAEAVGGAAVLAAGPHPGDPDYDEDEGDYAYLESLTAEQDGQLGAYVALAAYDAVRAGVPLFRELLGAADPGVRTMAAYTLAWFAEDAAGSVPALEGLLATEEDEGVAATALVAIGLLCEPAPAVSGVWGSGVEAFLTDDRPAVRWAAAVAGARVLGHGAGSDVVDELLSWTRGGRGSREEIPFLDGDLAGYAGQALAQVGPRHTGAAYDALLARLPDVSGSETLPVLTEALRMAFPEGWPDGAPASGLDDRQRRLARVLAENAGPWRLGELTFANVSNLVRSFGLPGDREAMAAFLD